MTLRTSIQLPTCPPDDSEESILGTGLHQLAISTLREGLLEAARVASAPWGVGGQISLLGMVKNDGTAYDPMPDVFVHPRPVGLSQTSLSLLDDGPPLLAIEVASPSTVANDIGDKADAYARAGVHEYLVFDPTGDLLGEHTRVRAYRTGPRGYQGWRPDRQGWWQSSVIDVSFEIQGLLLRVRDHNGNLVLVSGEERLARLKAEQAQWQAEQVQWQAEQARQQAEQARAAAEAQAHEEAQARRALEERLAAEAEARAALEAELHRLRVEREGHADGT